MYHRLKNSAKYPYTDSESISVLYANDLITVLDVSRTNDYTLSMHTGFSAATAKH